MSLEFSLLILALGALIFIYLVVRLVRERRARKRAESDEQSKESDEH
ncbi:MAG: hypothetical protein ACOCV2_06815 [Persicimonas sp.]